MTERFFTTDEIDFLEAASGLEIDEIDPDDAESFLDGYEEFASDLTEEEDADLVDMLDKMEFEANRVEWENSVEDF